ncbi:MAG: DUF481 domain-containing protein [Polaribacter sp.]|nr:DUF481 domain-containing protein [Polaribacter sp.]
MKKYLLLSLFIPTFIFAQLNESDTLKIKGQLSLTGFWQGGNVQTVIFRAKTEGSVEAFKNTVLKTSNSYVYQEFGKVKADEDILSLNFLYFNTHKKVYPLLLGFVSTNFRREIDIRYLFGGGLSFQIFNDKTNWIKMSLSTEYEQTNFNKTNFSRPEYNGNSTINTWRGTIWLNGKYHLFKKKLILNHESYFQPSFQDYKNYRWQADISAELPIWKYLNFKISYLHTSESLVIENQKQEDKFLSFGFTLKSF